MLRKQFLVAAGMLLAVLVLVLFASGTIALPGDQVFIDDAPSRLALAAKWLLVPGFSLLIGIGMVANRRFFSSDGIDGTRAPASPGLEINLRYNQNTLEQVLLAVIAWPLLALWLPAPQLGLIPVLAVLFGAGRIAFWLGYLIAPWARAFGFALTFYPTVAIFVWLAIRVLR
ncbi:MAG TPA: MAPEG family protein [Rhizomicrobium sp.]